MANPKLGQEEGRRICLLVFFGLACGKYGELNEYFGIFLNPWVWGCVWICFLSSWLDIGFSFEGPAHSPFTMQNSKHAAPIPILKCNFIKNNFPQTVHSIFFSRLLRKKKPSMSNSQLTTMKRYAPLQQHPEKPIVSHLWAKGGKPQLEFLYTVYTRAYQPPPAPIRKLQLMFSFLSCCVYVCGVSKVGCWEALFKGHGNMVEKGGWWKKRNKQRHESTPLFALIMQEEEETGFAQLVQCKHVLFANFGEERQELGN